MNVYTLSQCHGDPETLFIDDFDPPTTVLTLILEETMDAALRAALALLPEGTEVPDASDLSAILQSPEGLWYQLTT